MGVTTTSSISTYRWQFVPLVLALMAVTLLIVMPKVHHPMVGEGTGNGAITTENVDFEPRGEKGKQKQQQLLLREEEGGGMSVVVMDEHSDMSESEKRKGRSLFGGSKNYISYAVLRAEVVPCSKRGVPYYNCHAPPRFNAYHRACGIITRCARYDYP